MTRNKNFIIETPRLLMREMSLSDAESIYMLNSDPEVLRHTGDEPFESVEAARQFLISYDAFEKYGYGRMALILKDGFEFLGFCGLRYYDHRKATDIGFRLMQKYWNRGYATEAAAACLQYGFDTLKLKEIEGWCAPENTGSVRVLEKIGMQFESMQEEDGLQWKKYVISKG